MGLPDEGTNPVPPEVRPVGHAAPPVNVPQKPPTYSCMFGIRYPNIDRKASCSPTFCEVSQSGPGWRISVTDSYRPADRSAQCGPSRRTGSSSVRPNAG